MLYKSTPPAGLLLASALVVAVRGAVSVTGPSTVV